MLPEEPPDIPGFPGQMARFAHGFRRATQIFPPIGVGVGGGLGVGCGVGWPLRRAYGPPRAMCGPGVGVGIGIGYGQGIGRRFGKDRRSGAFTDRVRELEKNMDAWASGMVQAIRARLPWLRRGTGDESKKLTMLMLQTTGWVLSSTRSNMHSNDISKTGINGRILFTSNEPHKNGNPSFHPKLQTQNEDEGCTSIPIIGLENNPNKYGLTANASTLLVSQAIKQGLRKEPGGRY